MHWIESTKARKPLVWPPLPCTVRGCPITACAQYSVSELAQRVQALGNKRGLNVDVQHIQNPRLEKEEHYYKADHEQLKNLGFKATRHIDDEIKIMLDDLMDYKERINEKKDSIVKVIKWSGPSVPLQKS